VALLAAESGAQVTLYEQRPGRSTKLHETDLLAELVGSNDLGSESPDRAAALLKLELMELGCTILDCAQQARLSDGDLLVDRQQFAQFVTDAVTQHQRIRIRREEVRDLPDEGIVVLATGPTTWSPLARRIHEAAGGPFRFAFLGRPPLVDATQLSGNRHQWAPPYPGAEPLLFMPLSESEVSELVQRVNEAERAEPPGLNQATLAYEAEPIERIAQDPRRLHGRVLRGPRGKGSSARGCPALRLRPDDAGKQRYHVEDFVTAMTPQAQQQALRAASSLAEATVERPALIARVPHLLGSQALLPSLQMARTPTALVAGLLAGALGYLEAIATGCIAGINAARLARGQQAVAPPPETITGSLCRALATPETQGIGLASATFGLLPETPGGQDQSKSDRRARQAEAALAAIKKFVAEAV